MLSVKEKHVLLSVHLLFVSLWVGSLVAILMLNLSKHGSMSGDELYAVNFTIFRLHDKLVINAAYAVVLTGLMFSLWTKWGFIRFYWIIAKWCALLFFFFWIISYMGPAVNGMAALADVERWEAPGNPLYLQYQAGVTRYAVLELSALAFLVLISVFKPWGRLKKRRHANRKVALALSAIIFLSVIFQMLNEFVFLEIYRNLPIRHVDLTTLSDGTYTGEANYAFKYIVEVTVQDHEIKNIEIKKNRQNLYAKAAEGVTRKVMRSRSLTVDGVTGATTTSRILLKAIENAIVRGNVTLPTMEE